MFVSLHLWRHNRKSLTNFVRCCAQPLHLAAFAARGAPTPAFEGAAVLALLRCIIPPPLTKARFLRHMCLFRLS